MRGRHLGRAEPERDDFLRPDVDDAVNALEGASDFEDRCLVKRDSEPRSEVRSEDCIRETCFVFEGQKTEALG